MQYKCMFLIYEQILLMLLDMSIIVKFDVHIRTWNIAMIHFLPIYIYVNINVHFCHGHSIKTFYISCYLGRAQTKTERGKNWTKEKSCKDDQV